MADETIIRPTENIGTDVVSLPNQLMGLDKWNEAMQRVQSLGTFGAGVQPTQTTPEIGRIFGEGRGATPLENIGGVLSRLTDFGTNFASAFDKARQQQMALAQAKSPFQDPYAERRQVEREFKASDKINNLRSEYEKSDVYKEYGKATIQYNKLLNTLEGLPNGYKDMSTVYNLMKTLDPSSVVRESEYKMAASVGNVAEKFKSFINSKIQGQVLTPILRKQILDAAQEAMKANNEYFKGWRDTKIASAKPLVDYYKSHVPYEVNANDLFKDLSPLVQESKGISTGTQTTAKGVEGFDPSKTMTADDIKNATPEQLEARRNFLKGVNP